MSDSYQIDRLSARRHLSVGGVSLVAAMLLLPAVAGAGQWSVGAGGGYIVLGDVNATGGFATHVEGTWRASANPGVALDVGMKAAMFGFNDDPYWFGYLATGRLGLSYVAPVEALSAWKVSMAPTLSGGMVPIINNIGVPMRYLVVAPGVEAHLSYSTSKMFGVKGGYEGRLFLTPSWTDVSHGFGLAAVFSF